jgi:uncharacterized protein (TIGR03067 family)
MKLIRSAILFVLCTLTAAAQTGRKPAPELTEDEALQSLQGHWIFEKGEKNGAGGWSISEESIYIQKNHLHPVKKTGELIYGGNVCEVSVALGKPWTTIDLVQLSGGSGGKVLGIFKIEDDRLIIAMNTSRLDRRPEKFSTNLAAGPQRATNLLIYKKASTEGLVKPPVKKEKFTPAELDAANEAGLKSLQGHWLFEKAERNGYSHFVPSEESIYIEKKFLLPAKKNGDLTRGGDPCEIVVDMSKPWPALDLIRLSGDRGRKIQGIFKVDGDKLFFALSSSDDLKDLRPSYFSTRLAAGLERAAIVQTYKRAPGEALAKPPAKKDKLTKEEIDALNAETLKKLQGHWIFEKAERNGSSYWVLPEESIYIEKKILAQARKNGDLVFNGDVAEITIDATQGHIAIDLVRKNGNRGQKILGICKIDGDRLVIATNTSDDLKDVRPGYFTTRLTAGAERAATVQTYKKAARPE